MTTYRIDYMTRDGRRGTWEPEQEYDNLDAVKAILPGVLAYAKTCAREIDHLVVVEVTEKDVEL